MKYYISWIATIATIACPFMCFTASILNFSNTEVSTLYLLLGLFSLDGMSNVKFPKRDEAVEAEADTKN